MKIAKFMGYAFPLFYLHYGSGGMLKKNACVRMRTRVNSKFKPRHPLHNSNIWLDKINETKVCKFGIMLTQDNSAR